MSEFIIKHFVKDYKNTEIPSVRTSYGKVAGIAGIICNIILFALKLTISIITSSVAITADAINNLSDASSSIISLIGFKLSEKPADAKHPYGHGRYEYLSALCVAIIVILIGVELFKTSIDKIITPEKVNFGIPLVATLVFSVLLKLWMMFFNKKCAEKINSQTLHATAADCRNDCITTIAVLSGAVVSHFTDIELDGWIGLGVSVFILLCGFGLIKDTLDPLLGSVPDIEFILKIKEKILSYPKVLGIHDLIIHDYGPCRKFASVHVEMAGEDDVYENHDIIDNIETDFLKNEGLNIIIHYDPVATQNPLLNTMKNKVEKIVTEIDCRLSIHDFRMVPGNSHTNLIFDCVVPYDVNIEKNELINTICKQVKKIDEKYNCVIAIDENYTPINH